MPRPNEAMREEAQRGLDWRAEHGRGGTEVGVARARDIVNNRNLSIESEERMSDENTQNIEYKDFVWKMDEVDDEGYFTGYASTFTEDSMGDTIMPGAFKRTLNSWAAKQRPIPVLWQHKADEPIGATIEAFEDERGLMVRGRLLMGLQRAREAFEAAKAGILGGLSIGFSIPRDGAMRNDDGTRTIKELKLYEYSFVTFPANEAAVLTGLKSEQPELAEIRDLLSDIKRELRAASVATAKPVDETAPASDDVATLIADIRRQREALFSERSSQ
jgi:uncharacterized protein